jgi:hypothetical protein
MNGITRQSFIKISMLVIMLLLLMATLIYRVINQQAVLIQAKEQELVNITRELENMAKLSNALIMLDELTIDEKMATRLNLLRHLELEKSSYKFDIVSKQTKQIGDVNLFLRQIDIRAEMPYFAALLLADRLHNTRKMVINQIELSRVNTPGDNVGFYLKGTLYGLEKMSDAQL